MSEQMKQAMDQELRKWAVERACENTSRAPGGSAAQRRADILTMAKEFEAYVKGDSA